MLTRENASYRTFRKTAHHRSSEEGQGWEGTEVNDSLNVFDNSENRTPTLVLENHPQDSRVRICEDGIFQTLNKQMGTGGGNVPMVMEERNARTQNQILCILQETYGEEAVIEWGASILATLQQADVLRQGMYEGSLQGETEDREELDGSSLPCSEIVAEWILRDMRKQSECGCSSQGWESAEQRIEQSSETLQKLPCENTPSGKDLLDMWSKGEGLGLLQQALHQIQEIRRSNGILWEGGDGMNSVSTVVRRLTPL